MLLINRLVEKVTFLSELFDYFYNLPFKSLPSGWRELLVLIGIVGLSIIDMIYKENTK
jgi:hypothetical protein